MLDSKLPKIKLIGVVDSTIYLNNFLRKMY